MKRILHQSEFGSILHAQGSCLLYSTRLIVYLGIGIGFGGDYNTYCSIYIALRHALALLQKRQKASGKVQVTLVEKRSATSIKLLSMRRNVASRWAAKLSRYGQLRAFICVLTLEVMR